MSKNEEVILTPRAFNKQLTLVIITAVYAEQQKTGAYCLYRAAVREVQDLIYSINMSNPVRKPVTTILRMEVINGEEGFRITIGQKDIRSRKTILITRENKQLLFDWYKVGFKPHTLVEWRRVFGGQ